MITAMWLYLGTLTAWPGRAATSEAAAGEAALAGTALAGAALAANGRASAANRTMAVPSARRRLLSTGRMYVLLLIRPRRCRPRPRRHAALGWPPAAPAAG